MDKVLLDLMSPLRATFVTLTFEGSFISSLCAAIVGWIRYLVKIDQ